MQIRYAITPAATILLGCALFNPLPAQEKSSCESYSEDAVRVEPGGILSARKLVRSSSGLEVMKIRANTRELRQYFQSSDSAVYYALDFGGHQRRSSVLMALAAGTSFILPMVIDMEGDDKRALRWGAWGASFGFGLWGQAQQRKGERSLARAVWHYNAAVHDRAASCGTRAEADRTKAGTQVPDDPGNASDRA